MHLQTDLFFYRFRFVLAGLIALAVLVATSALVTAIGSGSVLDGKIRSPQPAADITLYDSSDAVTAAAYRIADGTKHALLSTGVALYKGCRSVTTATDQSGQAVLHGGAAVGHGIGSGFAFVGHGIGNTTMFTLRLPGRAVGSVAHTHSVSAIIKPASTTPVPVISSETSAAALASLNAAQQQAVARLQAAQLTANEGLGGSVIAGDPHHGGYPAGWDAPAAQDSRLDSWGMYNRECVSYTAWKVFQTYGHMPYWGGVGNANQWVRDARNAGIPTSSVPRVHSVAISMNGYYGHAMWVEAVSGNMIYVSQYNYDLHGHYSEMWVSSSSLTYIYFQ